MRCPASQSSAFAREVVTMHAMLSNHGILPAAGSYGEQPSKLMRMIDLVAMERNKIDDARPKPK